MGRKVWLDFAALSTFTGVLAKGMVTLPGGEKMLVALGKMLCRGGEGSVTRWVVAPGSEQQGAGEILGILWSLGRKIYLGKLLGPARGFLGI